MMFWRVLLSLLSLPGAILPAQVAAGDLLGHVRALAGKDLDSRRSHIVGSLRKAGLAPRLEEYVVQGRRGKNVVVRLGEEGPLLVLCAHIDSLRISPGANDDASGCAVLLGLAAEIGPRAKSLPFRLVILFADGGKQGHLGALDFLERRDGQPVLGCLSVDMVGRGDCVLLGRAPPREDNPLHALAAKALAADGRPWRSMTRMPPSEDRVFLKRGVPAVVLGIFPAAEGDALAAHLAHRGRQGHAPPATLAAALGSGDGVEAIQGTALVRALEAVDTLVRRLSLHPPRATPIRFSLPSRLRRLRRLLRDAEALRETTPAARADLLREVGPRAFLSAVLDALEKDPEEALPAVRMLLASHLAGGALRQPLAAALKTGDASALEEALDRLYRRHHDDLVWNEAKRAYEIAP